jgi:hypothetical protein
LGVKISFKEEKATSGKETKENKTKNADKEKKSI